MTDTLPELRAFKRAASLGLSQWENGNLTTNLAEKPRWLRKVIAQTCGLEVAADVIERAFRLPLYPQPLRPNTSKSMAVRRVVAHA